jgi:hypothetical protein
VCASLNHQQQAFIAKKESVVFLKEPTHILLVLVVIILLFGAKRLPDSARSLGKSLKIFKSEMKDMKDDKKPDQDGQASA